MSRGRVSNDLASNHGRRVTRSFIQDLAEMVGSAAQAKEESWHYQTPALEHAVATVAVGLDGTCLLLVKDGAR